MSGHRRASAAQALVEFALVLPLLVVLSLGLVQVVLYAHARDVLLSSVQEGARLAAEDGRLLDDGYARAQTLLTAGLGNSLDALQVAASLDDDVVAVRAEASLRPIMPLPLAQGLPLQAEARVMRERFRPGGGGR
jgi:hypothetical protein